MSDYYKKLYYGVTENNQIITKEINRLENNNKHLKLQLDQALKDYEELLIKIDKAIEYIKKHSNCSGYFEDGKMIIDNIESIYGGYELLEILGDKENVKD